nr:type II toxin-antitoxin system VapC family toxin [Devosia yakushimensis]
MFVDASALVALLSEEPEAERVSNAIAEAEAPFTSALVILETALALSRPDKWNLPIEQVEVVVLEVLEERGIVLKDLPEPLIATQLSINAAARFRRGRHGLNLADCLHYACAKHYDVPVLATDDEFRQTDLQVAP